MDIFLSEELQTQPDLSPARNILSLHHTSAWLKKVLGSNMIPLRTKFDTETTVISHRIKERERESERERDFLPLPAFFYGVSSLSSEIANITRVLAIRASYFYICRENLGQAT